METQFFLWLLIAVLAGTVVEAEPCGKVFDEPNGTIAVDTSAIEGQACVYTVMRNATSKANNLLQISGVMLAEGDKLEVFDGTQASNISIVSYAADASVAFQVAIGFQQNTTIVFTPSKNETTSKWSIFYNTEACQVDLTNTWALQVESLIYASAPTKSISCTYTVTSSLPLGQKAVVSFSSFELTGTSTLTVSSGDLSRVYKDGTPMDDFFAKDASSPIQMDIFIGNASAVQNFTGVVESVVADCSGEVNITDPLVVVRNIAEPSVSYVCRWQVRTTTPSLVASVNSLTVVQSNDRLSFIDGGSSYGGVLGSLSDSVNDPGYLVTTSSNVLMVSLTLGNLQGPRSLNMTLSGAAQGGRLDGQGTLTAKGDKSSNGTVYFQLVASPGQLVNVADILPLKDAASLTFYNGMQMSDPVLAVFTASAQDLKAVIGESQMLVVLVNLTADAAFNATFTSIQPGCDMLIADASGQLTYKEDESVKTVQTCTWTIAPVVKEVAVGTIVVDLNTVTLGADETVKIYSGLDNTNLLAQFAGPTMGQTQLPQLYAQASDRVRVVVARNDTTYRAATLVSLRYQVVPQACGGQFAAAGMIQTPNFPNQYPLNAECTWMTAGSSAKANQFLYINFLDLALAQNHSITVMNVNGTKTTQLAEYKGFSSTADDLPADLLVPFTNYTQITFQSKRDMSKPVVGDINQVGGGAKLKYQVVDCGGNITQADFSLATPMYPKTPNATVYCLWTVDVTPQKPNVNSTYIVNMTITAASNTSDMSKYLTIYDGSSSRSQNLQVNTTKGVFSLSRYNRIIVIFNYTKTAANAGDIGFNLTYTTKTCNKSEQCANGICLHPDWKCNGVNDCGDFSDEKGCTISPTVAPPTTTQKPAEADYSGWVKSAWVPACLFIGILLGGVLIFIAPRIIRRIRGRGGSYSRMEDDRPVVT